MPVGILTLLFLFPLFRPFSTQQSEGCYWHFSPTAPFALWWKAALWWITAASHRHLGWTSPTASASPPTPYCSLLCTPLPQGPALVTLSVCSSPGLGMACPQLIQSFFQRSPSPWGPLWLPWWDCHLLLHSCLFSSHLSPQYLAPSIILSILLFKTIFWTAALKSNIQKGIHLCLSAPSTEKSLA